MTQLKQQRKNPKEYEIIEHMDRVCEDTLGDYGIQLRNNRPTYKFSKDSQISRAQGSWASRYIKNVCSELYTDHEDAILRNIDKPRASFIRTMCSVESSLCNQEDMDNTELADFDVNDKHPITQHNAQIFDE
eukprot:CAMPEP_0113710282 /NCGR_PEP_ID=MMETSP0038_2-20120614/30064_1 /TAXON_ID=2898 /ORGANISM="Cryptomonas paramecium" /LENGTH=131 /DNA_ID=CAMNT_0000636309 /DNA_START=169 /DNA_END=562 /DNA_ORIENTATION=+ /assembly_acc=CAM_ASM_000170